MIQSLLSFFQSVPDELVVMLLAAMPIFELSASIPTGIAVFHLSPIVVYLFAIVGNLLPLLLVFFFLPKLLRLFAKHSPRAHALLDRYFFALTTKHVSSFDKYGSLFLFILVAIPNPGGGVWTASLLAILFRIHLKYAIPAIVGGILVSGLIVLALTETSIKLF